MKKPDKQTIERMYFEERLSTPDIGLRLGVSGRAVRYWMASYGIQLLGNTLFKRGAHFQKGHKTSPEDLKKAADVRRGKPAANFGQGRIAFLCEVCGSEVFDKPYRKRRTCSRECKNRLMSVLRGETHWNFKGDLAGYLQRQRLWAAVKDWRAAVIKRDDAKCRVCAGVTRLATHHLTAWSDAPTLRFVVGNGITLCKSCHLSYHKTKGFRHSTPEKFHEWLVAAGQSCSLPIP